MGDSNSFVGRTYFEGDVQMQVPPEYFLQRIYDYDALLVMFPSAKIPGAYVLARRREQTAGITDAAMLGIIQNPDTRTCVVMGFIPVCMVYQTGLSWNADIIIAKLKARDIRAQGGADKVADALEAQEAADAKALKDSIREDQWNRSGAAWRSYQHRTGASTIRSKDYFNSPRPEAADEPTASTPRSTAGLGADITPA